MCSNQGGIKKDRYRFRLHYASSEVCHANKLRGIFRESNIFLHLFFPGCIKRLRCSMKLYRVLETSYFSKTRCLVDCCACVGHWSIIIIAQRVTCAPEKGQLRNVMKNFARYREQEAEQRQQICALCASCVRHLVVLNREILTVFISLF